MKAIGWLILIIGLGVVIEGWQGKNPLHSLSDAVSGMPETRAVGVSTQPMKKRA
jgi:hypothetical protein